MEHDIECYSRAHSHLFVQLWRENIRDGSRKAFQKLLNWLLPSECWGVVKFAEGCSLQQLLNQKHEGKTQNQAVLKVSVSFPDPNVAHPALIKRQMRRTWEEKSIESIGPMRKPFLLNQNSFSNSLRNRDVELRQASRPPKGLTEENTETHKQSPIFREKQVPAVLQHHVPGKRPSEQIPGILTAPERIRWPHPRISTIPGSKPQFIQWTGRESFW